MEYELPTEFDLIVVGTGIIESAVSAAASRIGKRVLQIDSADYYGGIWASFNLESIQKLGIDVEKTVQVTEECKLNEGEKIVPMGNDLFNIKDITHTWHLPEFVEEVKSDNVPLCKESEVTETKEVDETVEDVCVKSSETQTRAKLMEDSRKFNIDLTPKLQFARGAFVELLISSNIARYSEFRSVSRVLTYLNGQLEVVPCSRSDVFSNSKVSVIEKRMLMKLLTTCMDENENEFKGYENKTFKTYLKDRKLTPNLVHYVLYAIAMSNDDTTCMDGVKSTKRFLTSLGRFGKTPFLYSMYGSGELPQAFCRMSAVFGGVFALNQPLNGYILNDENDFKGIICGKQRIRADYLLTGIDKAPEMFAKNFSKPTYISRAVFITKRSIMSSNQENLTLLLFPSENGKEVCYALELGTLTGTCPKGLYILHLFTPQRNNPQEDLKDYVDKLFPSDNTNVEDPVLWSFYYSVPDTNACNLRDGVPKNIFVCPGPDLDLDYDASIKKAKSIFEEMYPDLEMLPRAPDPEEIIGAGDDELLGYNNEDGEKVTGEEPLIEEDLNKSNEINLEATDEEKA